MRRSITGIQAQDIKKGTKKSSMNSVVCVMNEVLDGFSIFTVNYEIGYVLSKVSLCCRWVCMYARHVVQVMLLEVKCNLLLTNAVQDLDLRHMF
jgi:hypothetical protein